MTSRSALAIFMLIVSGCTDAPNTLGKAEQAVSTPSVSTDMQVYQQGAPITVTWAGLPGNDLDWVAIAYAGSPVDTGVQEWTYVHSQTSGSYQFNGLGAGQYEARAYSNNTFTIIATSTFTISGTTISTDMSIYPPNQAVTVSWSGMPGNPQDWVAVATAGAPANQVVQWVYVNSATSGTHAFTGLAQGNYEARAYLDNSFNILASSTFTIAAASTTIAPDSLTYATNAPITLTWTGMPGNQKDWIGITPSGSPPYTNIVAWTYIGGVTDGNHMFAGLNDGTYVARAYLDNSYTVLATSSVFTVSAQGTTTSATISTDSTNYLTNAPITVSWNGLPGNMNDWVALAAAGSPDSQILVWVYTNGAVMGSHAFSGLPNGSYEARAYLNNTYTVLARSSFSVTQGCVSAGQQRPVLGSLTSGDLTIGTTATEATASISAPLTTSILFFSTSENEPSPGYGAVLCELHAADTTRPAGVTCFRNSAGTDSGSGTITVHWTVATFTSGVTVQRGEAATYSANPTNAALTTVDMNSSFVVLGGMLNSGTGWGNNEFVRAQLLDANTLEVRTNSTGTSAAWQVVTMSGASVQRGSATFATGDTQQTVTTTTIPSGSMVLTSYTTDNASGIAAAALMMQSQITGPTTVTLQRSSGGSNLDVSWEVVSLPYATRAGVVDFAAGQALQTATVSGILAASSVTLATSQSILGQAAGSTTYAGSALDLPGEASAAISTSDGSVSFLRGTSQATAEIPWTVIDFAHDCTGN